MAKKNNLYLIKQGFKNITANSLMSFSSVSILFACLLLVGGAFLVYFNIQKGIKHVGGLSEIRLFVEDGVTEYSCRNEIEPVIAQMEGVRMVEFISSSQGLLEMQEQLDGGEELFEMYEGEEILPHSFRVKIEKAEEYDEMAELLSQLPNISKISTNGEVARMLTKIGKSVAVFGIGVVSVLLIVSVFILTNTIKLAMFTRRKEIYIMKMVGATNSFVRLPFLIEGIIIGLAAALLSFLALSWVYSELADYMVKLSIRPVEWKTVAWQILGYFSAAGAVVGLFSSTISIKRYLKV